jgi:hypothetical protein
MNTHFNYDYTFQQNLAFVSKALIGKNIIYSNQFISDDETQIDGDGPSSSWCIKLICIEKNDNDYIFHCFQSNWLESYSYPKYEVINKWNPFTLNFSNFKNNIDSIFEKSCKDIDNFIKSWNDVYCLGFRSNDENLIKELNNLAPKIEELEILYDKKLEIQSVEQKRLYDEYIQSNENKEYQKKIEQYKIQQEEEYTKKENERLKYLVDKYGEEQGRRYWQCL